MIIFQEGFSENRIVFYKKKSRNDNSNFYKLVLYVRFHSVRSKSIEGLTDRSAKRSLHVVSAF